MAPLLSTLDLRGNCLTTLEGLRGLDRLAVLDVSHNHLTSLQGLEGCLGLLEIDASANRIKQPNLLPWLVGPSSASGCGGNSSMGSIDKRIWPYQVLRKLKLNQNSIPRLENLPPMPALVELGLQVC